MERHSEQSILTQEVTELPQERQLPVDIPKLEELIGHTTIKQEIVALKNFLQIQISRQKNGLKTPTVSNHLVFTGNPGTGKTTVARIVAQIYKELGILKKGHLVETDRSGLVGQYIGHTAIKTNKIIDSALDGVLFIDEAYALSNDNNRDYGAEAIATLIKRMEDDRNRLVVILAGYPDEMKVFLDSNPGIRSRFNRYIHFPDYSLDELMQIFEQQCSKNDYTFTDEARQNLKLLFQSNLKKKDRNFGNGRFVRNVFEKTIHCQANRLVLQKKHSKQDLRIIEAKDIPLGTVKPKDSVIPPLIAMLICVMLIWAFDNSGSRPIAQNVQETECTDSLVYSSISENEDYIMFNK